MSSSRRRQISKGTGKAGRAGRVKGGSEDSQTGNGKIANSEDLRRRLQAVREEWLQRRTQKRRKGSSEPYDHASAYLKRAVYTLSLELPREACEVNQLVEGLRGRALTNQRSVKSIYLGLLGLIASDDELKRPEKYRYAAELTYARRHRVPAELLVGFILQVGSQLKVRVRDKNHHEDWFNTDRHTFEAYYRQAPNLD